jgi:type IX secretion system PorP/SprF family membrane protein
MKKFTFLISCVLFSNLYFAQDSFFTNTNQSLVYLNPSFAGSNGLIRNQFIHKRPAGGSAYYQSFNNTLDAFIKPINGGLALSYFGSNNGYGIIKTDKLDLTYAQHFYLRDRKLMIIPSLQLSYFEKRLDNSNNLIFPVTPQTNMEDLKSKKANVDLSSGLLINYKRFYFGTSVFHINQPDEGLTGYSKLPYRLSSFTSYNWLLNDNTLLHFVARFEKQQTLTNYQLAVNALIFKHAIIGLGFRSKYSPYLNLGFRAKYFTLQASYEYNLSSVYLNYWEFSASFNLRDKEQRNLLTNFETW